MNIQLLKSAFIIFSLGVTSLPVVAHSRWLLPSHTRVSGEQTTSVSIAASISNDIFHADRALGGQPPQSSGVADANKTQLSIIAPDGKQEKRALFSFARQSVAQVDLLQSGTYLIMVDEPPRLFTSYKKADGSMGRFRGTKEEALKELGDSVSDIKTQKNIANVGTFVTRNAPTAKTLLTHKGLELGGKTHPNDIFVGEAAHFQLFLNGQPAPEGIEVSLLRDGTRHRNERGALKLKTQKEGLFDATLTEAGYYLLEASYQLQQSTSEADSINYALSMTLEVNPE